MMNANDAAFDAWDVRLEGPGDEDDDLPDPEWDGEDSGVWTDDVTTVGFKTRVTR